MARGSTQSIWTRSSTHFLPRRTSERAWGWAWPSATGLSRSTTGASRSAPSRGSSASLRWSFRRRGEIHKGRSRMDNLYDYKKFAILYVDDEEKSLKYFVRAFEEQ